MKTNALALVVVEILLCRCSAQKIVTDSRIKLQIASCLAMTIKSNATISRRATTRSG